MIIAIEGHAGVGKTTLAKALSKELDFEYVKFPLGELMGLNIESDYSALTNIVKYGNSFITAWFLALNDIYALTHYRDKNAVVDRLLLTNYLFNYSDETKDIFELSMKYSGKPDLFILLEASKEIRIQRIKERNPCDMNLNKETSCSAENSALIDLLQKLDYRYDIIDVSNLNKEAVLKKAKKIIENLY